MSAVSIGGQTFIKSEAGWVDKKTKQPAPEGLMKLLNNVSAEESPAEKKARVRIDTTRPVVKLGKSEYVWDLNGQVWIDKKTKDPVNPNFSKLIEATYQSIDHDVTPEEELYKKWAETAAKGQVFSGMGVTGKAAQQKVKKPSGGGTLTVPNVKINSPIVTMIDKLATIDGYLKQRLDNQKKIAARNIIAAKETSIENLPVDAEPIIEKAPKEDAEKSNAAAIGVALVVGGLIAAQFEPVQEAFKSLADGIKGVWNFVNNAAKTISDGLDAMTGTSSSSNTSSASNRNVSSRSSSSLAPSVPNTASETTEGQLEPNEVQPSVITSSPSADNATSVVPTTSNTGPSRLGRAVIGAAVGAAATRNPVGAIVGGAVGFLSSPSSSETATSVSNGSPSTSSSPPTQPSSGASGESQTPSNQSSTPQTSATPQEATPGTSIDATKISGSDYGGLTIKGGHPGQATAGGPAAENTVKFAKIVQPGLGSMFSRFTAFNDRYHQGIKEYTSPHTRGVAFDLTLRDPSQSSAAATKIKQLADQHKFKVSILNEYTNPTAKSTGGHIHVTVHGPGVGSTVRGGSGSGEPGGEGSMVGKAASAIWDISAGAIEALGGIIKAGLGPTASRSITDSLMSSAPSAAGDIASASVQRVGAIAQSRSESPITANARIPDPPNLNAGTETPVVQNIPTSSDYAGVEFYLTRMGFPKIEYAKPQQSTRWA